MPNIPKNIYSKSALTPTAFQGAVEHMNKDHTHNLTNIIQAHLKLSRPPTNVQMTSMDHEGFQVKYTTTPASLWRSQSKPVTRGVRIPWKDGKIKDSKDARVQLVALSESSDKLVGKTHIVYSLPMDFPLSIVLWATLYYIDSNPQLKQTIKSNLPQAILSLAAKSPIQLNIPQFLGYIFKAHSLEALLMLALVIYRASGSRATVSPLTAIAWAITTFSVGFPTFFKFNLLNPVVKSSRK